MFPPSPVFVCLDWRKLPGCQNQQSGSPTRLSDGWMHTEQCTVYSAQCTVYTVSCAVHIVQCTVCSVQFVLYSVQCTVYTVHCKLYTLYIVHHTINSVPCSTLYTPKLFTLKFKLYIFCQLTTNPCLEHIFYTSVLLSCIYMQQKS